jgi:hypothetical protein
MVQIEQYGFELENYAHLFYDFDEEMRGEDHKDEIYQILVNEEGLGFIEEVKGDGSLSRGGFEINCGVFEGFKEFKDSIIQTNNIMLKKGWKPKSPCAIHIHNGFMKKPTNFMLLSIAMDNLWAKIISRNNSGIYWARDTIIPSRPHKKTCLDINDFRNELRRGVIPTSRGRTLRNRINRTIEFRAIPYRSYPKYLETWLKMYEGLKRRANYLSYEKAKETYNTQRRGSLKDNLEFIQELGGLKEYDIFVLGHKINDRTKELWKGIKKRGYKLDKILLASTLLLREDERRVTEEDIREIGWGISTPQKRKLVVDYIMDQMDLKGIEYNEIEDSGLIYPTSNQYCSPQRDPSQRLDNIMCAIITYTETWDFLNETGFSFSETSINQLYTHLFERSMVPGIFQITRNFFE